MNFLFPLYLLGIAAVAIPVILHLRRRPPVERTDFSSLMFLEASPMERKRRRRLENLLVLLLRCALICLLAFLFARPLFRGEGFAGSGGDGRFVVILLDRSASMQREDLWERAVSAAGEAAAKAGEGDRVAVVSFDANADLLIGFEQWEKEGAGRRAGLVESGLEGIEAGWGSTDLGGAITFAVELIEEARGIARTGGAEGAGPGEDSAGEIVLLSDLQEGADRRALDTAGWPANTVLVVEALAPKEEGNASLHLLPSEKVITLRSEEEAATGEDAEKGEGALRLRLYNEAVSLAEDFKIGWAGRDEDREDYVLGPGAQRTFRMEVPEGGEVLELEGDGHDFDNRVYVVPEAPRPLRVFYLDGEEGGESDTADPFFYLERAVQATNLHAPVIGRKIPEGFTLEEAADFVVVAGAVEEEVAAEVRRYLERGGSALVLLRSAEQGEVLGSLMGAEDFAMEEAELEGDYALLEGIDFDEPALRAFEDPRVRDFSKVRYWRYRKPGGEREWPEGARVLARFDSGDAAWLSMEVGEGELVIFASGWHPADSQLGLSTKFVPLLYSLLENKGEGAPGGAQFLVGDALPVAPGSAVMRPDGVEERAGESGLYGRADLPGIYRARGTAGERVFAVNLDHRESRTEAMPIESLEEAGVAIAGRGGEGAEAGAAAETPERRRSMLDVEREKRQQLWRWLVFGAILVVFLEMLLTGRKGQPRAAEAV